MTNIEALLKKTGIVALCLVPLVPLVVYTGFLFPYSSPRNFFLRTVVLVAFSAWLLLWMYKPSAYRPRSSFLSWTALVFTAIIGAATAFAPYPSLAFWSTLERMDGFIGTLFLSAFFFAALNLLSARLWRIFFHISLGTALVESVIAILQLTGIFTIHQGGVRIDATFGNASFFSAYMFFSVGLALFFAAGEMVRRRRLSYIACAGVFIFLTLASATRSAFIAFPIALFVSAAAAFFMRADNARLKQFCITVFVGLALLAGSFFVLRHTPLATHPLIGRFLSISLTGADAEARFLSWKIALKGAAERPFFGWGPEGFRTVFSKYYDPRLGGREQWFDRAHNNYLDWLVQAGIFGLLAYLALWFGLMRAVWRRESEFSAWEKVALSGMFAGYAAFNAFSFDTITASVFFFSFLAFVESRTHTSPQPPLKGGASENPPLREVSRRFWSGRRMFFSALVCMAAMFIFYFAIAKPAIAARYIWLGLQSDSPSVDTRLAYFTSAIDLNTFATSEAREMLAQFAVDVVGAKLTNESHKKIITLAAKELAQQVEESPGDPRYLLRLGATLNAYRAYQIAAPILEQAVALSPKKQPSIYELGTSYLNLGQFEKAVEVFKRAADLLPRDQDTESKKLYVVALVYARRFADAEAYMRTVFNVPFFYDSRLAHAYDRNGQHEKAASILEYLRLHEKN